MLGDSEGVTQELAGDVLILGKAIQP